jgi:hypothetical protein
MRELSAVKEGIHQLQQLLLIILYRFAEELIVIAAKLFNDAVDDHGRKNAVLFINRPLFLKNPGRFPA